MSALRLRLGIRNTHGLASNLLYAAHRRYAKLRCRIETSAAAEKLALELADTGIAVLGTSDVAQLAEVVERELEQIPMVDGYAQLPRAQNPKVVPHLFAILQQHAPAIEACLGSHFRVNWFEVQEIAPGRQSTGSSFGYHSDDSPLPVLKLFVYLTDTFESNGAFRAFAYLHTDRLLRLGMLESVNPGQPRESAQARVPEGDGLPVRQQSDSQGNPAATGCEGPRQHGDHALPPAIEGGGPDEGLRPGNQALFPREPLPPLIRRPRRTLPMNPMLNIARRLLNPLGIDLVRHDPTRRSNSAVNEPRVKAPVPARIVIGGGDHEYGSLWHNIDYVTEGYADKYKHLPRNIDIAHDLTSRTPFPIEDGTLVAAYTAHVIEHLKDEPVAYVFRDTCRVLKKSGIFRLSCPNIDLYVRALRDNDLDFFHYRGHPHYARLGIQDSVVGLFLDVFATALGEGTSRPTREEFLGAMDTLGVDRALDHYCRQVSYDYSKSHYHVNWFSPQKLSAMLREAGFDEVYLSAMGQSYCADMRNLSRFDWGDPKISMFIECRK
jgi:predicted SAM-dependent methyltransferase